jgi:putative heme-binding domain-containing protein
LVQRKDKTATLKLRELARRGSSDYGRAHALWTLEGLNALDDPSVLEALSDANPRIREQAIRLAEKGSSKPEVTEKLLQMANDDPDERVQFQLACTLGGFFAGTSKTSSAKRSEPRPLGSGPSDDVPLAGARGSEFSSRFDALHQIALRHIDDSWFQVAVLTSASQTAERWFHSLTSDRNFMEAPAKGKEEFLRRIASIVGARMNSEEIARIVTSVSQHGPADWWRIASLDGLAEGLKRGGLNRLDLSPESRSRLLQLLEGPAVLRSAALRLASVVRLADSGELRGIIQRASATALNDQSKLDERIHALGVLGLDLSGSAIPVLGKFLVPQQPEPLQVAAANALLATRDPRVLDILLDKWRSYTAVVRDVVLAGFFKERKSIYLLLDAIKEGKVQSWSLGGVRRAQLIKFPDSEIRDRARALLADSGDESRRLFWERYRPAVKMRGNGVRGQQVFKETCSKCHRIGNIGFEVGPDLKTIANRAREDILTQILNPNANIAPGYEDYMVETRDGKLITGIIARQTANTVTLRRALGEEDTILRSNIADLRSLSVSQMPEDLAQAISVQGMADLLEYLKSLNQVHVLRNRTHRSPGGTQAP